MKRSSILTTSPAGSDKKKQKTFTNINQNVSGPALKTALQKINALTTDTYVNSSVVDKYDLDTESPPVVTPDTRPIPTLSVSNVPSLADINSNSSSSLLSVTYTGDGVTYAYRKSGCDKIAFSMYSNTQMLIKKADTSSSIVATAGTFILGATGTDNYQPVEVEYTIQ